MTDLNAIIPVTDSFDLTPAEQNVVNTQHLARHMEGCFVLMGRLLKTNRDNAYWSLAGYETWKDYVEQVGIGSPNTASRLIQIYSVVEDKILTEAEVQAIGVTKMKMLLPTIKDGQVDPGLLDIATHGPISDLATALGRPPKDKNRAFKIICPRCGVEIPGAKYVEKTDGQTDTGKGGQPL